MSTATDKYTVDWCRNNPDKALLIILHYEKSWEDASQACNRIAQERDAMAAELEHVHAERDALEAPAVQADPVAEVRIEKDYWNRGHFYEGRRKELKAVSSIQDLPVGTKLYAAQQPAASLARLIAEKQAEALEELAKEFRAAWPEHNGKHAWILGAMAKLRRQAEGETE